MRQLLSAIIRMFVCKHPTVFSTILIAFRLPKHDPEPMKDTALYHLSCNKNNKHLPKNHQKKNVGIESDSFFFKRRSRRMQYVDILCI